MRIQPNQIITLTIFSTSIQQIVFVDHIHAIQSRRAGEIGCHMRIGSGHEWETFTETVDEVFSKIESIA